MKSKLLAATAAVLIAGAANASSEQFNFAVMDAEFSGVGLLFFSESNGVDAASLSMDGEPRASFYFTDPGSTDYHNSGTIDLQIVDHRLVHFNADYHICDDDRCHFGRRWVIEGDGSGGSMEIFSPFGEIFAGTYSLLPTIPEPANVLLLLAGLGIVGVGVGRKSA